MIESGPSARSVQINLNHFTLIGATTRAGLLTQPLRDRFSIPCRLDYYDVDILTKIVKRSADILCVKISENAAIEIATRSRGTPRIANRLIRRVRDYAEVHSSSNMLDVQLVNDALDLHRVDQRGLDATDRSYIGLIVNQYQGGPVGLETLAAALGEDSTTIETVVEPYLMQIGFLQRTARGRIVTPAAEKHYLRTSSNKKDK